jgi:hypothetical protein
MRTTKKPLIPSLYLGLRQKAISSINEAVAHRRRCTSDEAIEALFIVASLESIYGEVSVFHVHMKGLAKMVDLRGGIDALGLGGVLGELVMWIDSKHYGNDCYIGQSMGMKDQHLPFRHPGLAKSSGPSRYSLQEHHLYGSHAEN